MKIDMRTIEMIKLLRDGRKSYREVAEALSLSENTVRSRVAKLRETGVLDICGLVDPEALPGHTVVMVGVKLRTMELVNKAKEISRLNGVVNAVVVTGRFDLIITLLLKEDFSLLHFYTEEMSRVDEIDSVETFVVYKSYNLKVPYIL